MPTETLRPGGAWDYLVKFSRRPKRSTREVSERFGDGRSHVAHARHRRARYQIALIGRSRCSRRSPANVADLNATDADVRRSGQLDYLAGHSSPAVDVGSRFPVAALLDPREEGLHRLAAVDTRRCSGGRNELVQGLEEFAGCVLSSVRNGALRYRTPSLTPDAADVRGRCDGRPGHGCRTCAGIPQNPWFGGILR
jgi:hypothetical protein